MLTKAHPTTIKVRGTATWTIWQPDDLDCWIGDCDDLNITLQTDTHDGLMDEIRAVQDMTFQDLYADGRLDQFLRDRGWTLDNEASEASTFDLPFTTKARSAHAPAAAH